MFINGCKLKYSGSNYETKTEKKIHYNLPRKIRWFWVKIINYFYSFLMFHAICKSCIYWDTSIQECYWFNECLYCPCFKSIKNELSWF